MYCIEGQLVASGQLLLAGVPGSHYRLLLDDFGYGSSGTKWRFGCPALNTSKCQTISDRTDQRISANCRTDPMGILQLDGLYLGVDNLPTTIIWGAARRLFRDPIQSQGGDLYVLWGGAMHAASGAASCRQESRVPAYHSISTQILSQTAGESPLMAITIATSRMSRSGPNRSRIGFPECSVTHAVHTTEGGQTGFTWGGAKLAGRGWQSGIGARPFSCPLSWRKQLWTYR